MMLIMMLKVMSVKEQVRRQEERNNGNEPERRNHHATNQIHHPHNTSVQDRLSTPERRLTPVKAIHGSGSHRCTLLSGVRHVLSLVGAMLFQPEGQNSLVTLWRIFKGEGSVLGSPTSRSRAPAGTQDYGAMVAAMSQTVADLNREVARALRTLATQTETC
jgi:ABC-type transport auxiliary lipoprotein component